MKVGSVVRILKDTFRKGYIGIVVTVHSDDPEHFIEVLFDNGYKQWYYPRSLEVICEGR